MGTGKTNCTGNGDKVLKIYRGSVTRPSTIAVEDNDFSVNVGHPVKYVYVKTSTAYAMDDEATRFARVWDGQDTNLSAKGLPAFVVTGCTEKENTTYLEGGAEATYLERSSNEKSFTIYGSRIARRGMTFTWTAVCWEE